MGGGLSLGGFVVGYICRGVGLSVMGLSWEGLSWVGLSWLGFVEGYVFRCTQNNYGRSLKITMLKKRKVYFAMLTQMFSLLLLPYA